MTKEALVYNGVKIASLINDVGRPRLIHEKKMKLDNQLIPYTRINSKWIKDLSISCDIIKVLVEKIGSKISDIPHSNIFADTTPRVREIKEKNK